MAVQPLDAVRPLPRYPGSVRAIMGRIQDDPLALFIEATRKHGDALMFDLFLRRLAVFVDPDDIYHVLVGNHRNYTKETRGYKALKAILGNGLVTSQGDFWKRQRRIAQPAFHRKRIAALAGVMTERTEALLERWAPSVGNGTILDVSSEMMGLTLEIVCETLLGVKARGNATEAIADAIEVGLEYIGYRTRGIIQLPEFLPTPTNLRFKKAVQTLDDVVLGIIDERRRSSNEHRNDLLTMFMEIQDEDTGERMDDRQLRDEVMTMFLAGHETTAMNLTWTLYLLSQHPHIIKRVQNELNEVLGGRTPTFEDLASLTYLDCVIKESMRLYPPVPLLARVPIEDDVIGGYFVPAGSYVIISAHATHRHPRLWEDPELFKPERFREENKHNIPKRGYFPFSMGQRKCIGDSFAMMEARLILAMLLQKVSPVLVPGHPVETEVHVTLRAKHGMNMRLQPVV